MGSLLDDAPIHAMKVKPAKTCFVPLPTTSRLPSPRLVIYPPALQSGGTSRSAAGDLLSPRSQYLGDFSIRSAVREMARTRSEAIHPTDLPSPHAVPWRPPRLAPLEHRPPVPSTVK